MINEQKKPFSESSKPVSHSEMPDPGLKQALKICWLSGIDVELFFDETDCKQERCQSHFGYRRIHALLRREGVDVNHKTHLSRNSASAFFLLPGTFWLIVPHIYTCLSPLGRPPGSLPLKLPGFSLNSPHMRAIFLHFNRLNCRSVNFPQHDKRHEASNESPKH